MSDTYENINTLDRHLNIEKNGVQAVHWLTNTALGLPLKKRYDLVQHIQSEAVAVAFHHNSAFSATKIRNYLTQDLFTYTQENPNQSQFIQQKIKDFSIWAAAQAPSLSSVMQKMFKDILTDKGCATKDLDALHPYCNYTGISK